MANLTDVSTDMVINPVIASPYIPAYIESIVDSRTYANIEDKLAIIAKQSVT